MIQLAVQNNNIFFNRIMNQPALGAVHQRWVFLAVLAQDVAFRALGGGGVRGKSGFGFGLVILRLDWRHYWCITPDSLINKNSCENMFLLPEIS